MGKEGKKKGKKGGTHRGNRGKGSSFMRGHLNELNQGIVTAQKRRNHRMERTTDPDAPPVEHIIVPQIPHDGRTCVESANQDVVKYYRAIGPPRHPVLAVSDDKSIKDKWTVAWKDMRPGWVEAVGGKEFLCPVVGHMTSEPPAPGCGIRIGKNRFIDWSRVPVDLGYHTFKPHLQLETMAAMPNFVKFMRRDPEYFNCILWRDELSEKVVWVRPVRWASAKDPIVLRDDPDFFLDGTAINDKKSDDK
jgi:hypothetical protein